MKKVFLCILCVCLTVCLFGCGVETTDARPSLSPAFDLLRSDTALVRAVVKGESFSFAESDFVGLTGEDTDYIVVNTLPETDVGVLLLNGKALLSGQTVPRSSFGELRFVPSAGAESEATFTFTAHAPGWETRSLNAVLVLQDTPNYAPVAKDGEETTFSAVTCFATLDATDPNGDAVTYRVTSYPRHGTLTQNGNEIRYTPRDGYVGDDSLTFRALDRFGNISSEQTLLFHVTESKNGLRFADLQSSKAHNAAIALCEANIMTYRKENGRYCFDPTEPVSKVDALVMMMCLCGKDDAVVAVAQTGVKDDKGLPTGKKGFLQTALSSGILHLENGCFAPNEPVTVADAAYMAAALLGLPDVSAGNASLVAPVWASDALDRVISCGVFAPTDAEHILTKEEFALFLAGMQRYRNP